MSNGYLSDEDLRKLTGFKHRKKQEQELLRQGIPYTINGRGEVVVSWLNASNKESSTQFNEPVWSV